MAWEGTGPVRMDVIAAQSEQGSSGFDKVGRAISPAAGWCAVRPRRSLDARPRRARLRRGRAADRAGAGAADRHARAPARQRVRTAGRDGGADGRGSVQELRGHDPEHRIEAGAATFDRLLLAARGSLHGADHADQPHFTREFRHVMHATPSACLAARRPLMLIVEDESKIGRSDRFCIDAGWQQSASPRASRQRAGQVRCVLQHLVFRIDRADRDRNVAQQVAQMPSPLRRKAERGGGQA